VCTNRAVLAFYLSFFYFVFFHSKSGIQANEFLLVPFLFFQEIPDVKEDMVKERASGFVKLMAKKCFHSILEATKAN
jgi:hypothetical protein